MCSVHNLVVKRAHASSHPSLSIAAYSWTQGHRGHLEPLPAVLRQACANNPRQIFSSSGQKWTHDADGFIYSVRWLNFNHHFKSVIQNTGIYWTVDLSAFWIFTVMSPKYASSQSDDYCASRRTVVKHFQKAVINHVWGSWIHCGLTYWLVRSVKTSDHK